MHVKNVKEKGGGKERERERGGEKRKGRRLVRENDNRIGGKIKK